MLPPEHYERLAQSGSPMAEAFASLAIAATQDRANELQEEANELKRIEVLAFLASGEGVHDEAYDALFDRTPPQGDKGWQHHGFKASVAVMLGLDTERNTEEVAPVLMVLDLEASKALPIGTSIVDAYGYWKGRTYIKTGEVTWALFGKQEPTPLQVWKAVDEKRNNLSPGNLGKPVYVTLPPARPSYNDTKEQEA